MEMKTETLAKYRHMSFIHEEYVGYQKFEAFKSAKSLRTFLAVSVGVKESSDCFYLSNKILVDILPKLPLLRVLSLSCFEISEVPQCIVCLKHLRYLNLSQTKIKELPENVGNLHNLQAPIVFGCDKLCKLPKSFSKLKNLRHFDIRDTPLLKQMPLGIGELNSLQTLSKIIIEGDGGFTIAELKELKNLEGKICIEGLDKVQDARHARDASLLTKRLTEVELVWDDVSNDFRNKALENEILSELKPSNDALKKFKIASYSGTKFPNWVGDTSFHKLVHVSICDCRNCKSLPALRRLQSLKELYIKGMDAVIVIGLELLGASGVAFPSLEILSFQSMFGWSVWSTNSGDVDCPSMDGCFPLGYWPPNLCYLQIGALKKPISEWRPQNFPTSLVDLYLAGGTREDDVARNLSELSRHLLIPSNLTTLRIWGFEKLETVSVGLQHLTSLQHLQFEGCPKLKDLPEKLLPSLLSLEIEDCPKLKEKTTSKSGSYWHKILHIPRIEIDRELQN